MTDREHNGFPHEPQHPPVAEPPRPDRDPADRHDGEHQKRQQHRMQHGEHTGQGKGQDDDLLHQSEAEAGAGSLRREKWTEHALAKRRVDAGPVVVDGDPRHLQHGIEIGVNHNLRRRGSADARLDGVAQQVAEGLAEQNLVAFDDAELAAHLHVPAGGARVGPDFLGRALADGAQVDFSQGQLRGAREVQEVGHDLAQGFGL